MTEYNIETTNQAPKSIHIFSDIYLFKNNATGVCIEIAHMYFGSVADMFPLSPNLECKRLHNKRSLVAVLRHLIHVTNQNPRSIRIFSDIYLFKNKAILSFYKKLALFGPKIAGNRKTN